MIDERYWHDDARTNELIELPPGDPGTPPHRHSGPVFGYMLEDEMEFELEGEPERVIRAGEAFWERHSGTNVSTATRASESR